MKIHGFTLLRKEPLPELSGFLHEMVHDGTGAKLVWLDRPDENKTFCVAFSTLPENSTGVFHILEHSLLCGSENYPSKEPFVEIMKNSMNTFINAFTFPTNLNSSACKGTFHEFSDGSCFTGCNDKIFRFFLLKHQPHTFYIVFCITPVTFSVEISKIQFFLFSFYNVSYC